MELSESEIADLRIILNDWYGPSTVAHWNLNVRVLNTFSQAVSELQSCSTAMNLVPRPMARPDGYIRRQLPSIARRARNSDAQYLICRDAARHRYRTQFELAGRGL